MICTNFFLAAQRMHDFFSQSWQSINLPGRLPTTPSKVKWFAPFGGITQENELKITFRRFLYAPVGRGRDSILNR